MLVRLSFMQLLSHISDIVKILNAHYGKSVLNWSILLRDGVFRGSILKPGWPFSSVRWSAVKGGGPWTTKPGSSPSLSCACNPYPHPRSHQPLCVNICDCCIDIFILVSVECWSELRICIICYIYFLVSHSMCIIGMFCVCMVLSCSSVYITSPWCSYY